MVIGCLGFDEAGNVGTVVSRTHHDPLGKGKVRHVCSVVVHNSNVEAHRTDALPH